MLQQSSSVKLGAYLFIQYTRQDIRWWNFWFWCVFIVRIKLISDNKESIMWNLICLSLIVVSPQPGDCQSLFSDLKTMNSSFYSGLNHVNQSSVNIIHHTLIVSTHDSFAWVVLKVFLPIY